MVTKKSLDNSENTAKETTNLQSESNELIERHTIENTPFTVIRQDKEWYVLMGKYRLTEALKTKDEAFASALDESWNRILQVIMIMIQDNEKQRLEKVTETINNLKINK